jgi:hypothetical protein
MNIVTAVAWVTLTFVALLGLAIIWNIFTGKIDLARLISEPSGDASMSRFQLLIFTFVIALSLFLIVSSTREPNFSTSQVTYSHFSESARAHTSSAREFRSAKPKQSRIVRHLSL